MDATIILKAGFGVEIGEKSDFFRLLDAQVTNAITIVFYNAGREVSRAENLSEGYAEEFRRETFDKVRIESSVDQEIHFVTRYGSTVSYDKAPQGDVKITGAACDFANHQVAVTALAALTLRAANANRKYLLIQNTDAANVLRIRFDGTDPDAATGLRIAPGGYWESNALAVPAGAIKAITESGTVAVEIVEG